jgi:hypothetical protein
MERNNIDSVRNTDSLIPTRLGGIFGEKTINNTRGSFLKSHTPTKLFKKLIMRLMNALAMAEVIHIAFFKTPEQVRLEAIKQEILRQEDMQREMSC